MVARSLVPRLEPAPVARLDSRLPIANRTIQATPKMSRRGERFHDDDWRAGAIWYESKRCDAQSIVAAITDYLNLVESET